MVWLTAIALSSLSIEILRYQKRLGARVPQASESRHSILATFQIVPDARLGLKRKRCLTKGSLRSVEHAGSGQFAIIHMAMKNPVHPGLVVRHDCIKPLNLTIAAAAKMAPITISAGSMGLSLCQQVSP